MATNFGLTTSSPDVNIIQSINYLLATQGTSTGNANVQVAGNVVQINANTGQIYNSNVGVISYLYGYIDIAYANTATGGGFSTNSINKSYYGIHNVQTPTYDSNPADYQWTQVAGGFGTTKGLYYQTSGGNTINFYIGTSAPSIYYTPVIDSTPILLALVGNSSVVANSIQPQAITNVQIASNTIQGQNIQLGTITANLLAVGTIIVSNSIQSNNAIFGNTSSPGYWLDSSTGNVRFGGNVSIGSNLTVGNNAVIGSDLSVGNSAVIGSDLSVGNNAVIGSNLSVGNNTVIGSNLFVGNNASIGSNLFVGNNTVIGSNLTVGNNAVIGGNVTINGVVTAGNINANTVSTTVLQTQSATSVVNVVGEGDVNELTFVNGNTSTYGQPGYLWPTNTRGFGSAGATIIPTTNGSVVGSQITVNWNTYMNTLQYSQYNLVELWKNGQSYFYQNNLQRVSCALNFSQSSTVNADYDDIFTATGLNGSLLVYNYPKTNFANPGTWFYTPFQNQTGNVQILNSGTTSSLYSQTSYFSSADSADESGDIYFGANYYLPDLDSNIPFFTYAAVPLALGLSEYNGNYYEVYGYNTVVVGAGGQIMAMHFYTIGVDGNPPAGNPNVIEYYTSETSGVLADLYDVAIGTSTSTTTGILTVAVGTGGTIITTTRNYATSQYGIPTFSSQTGWAQQGSGTSFNLNAVCSNWQSGLSKWVAVGDHGTILTASASASGWTAQTSGTTNNLYGVAYSPYGGGKWTVVGAGGIILYSTDTINWVTVDSPFPGRDLYSVCVGIKNTNNVVACGQEIMIKSTAGGQYFANIYTGGSSLASSLTRLQYYGSWANIANVSQPPPQQQITNGQIISGSYTDSNYVAGNPQIYYVVLGNLTGNTTVYSSQTSLTVTEFKR